MALATAGLRDPNRLTPSKSIVVTRDGTVLEDLDVTGQITVKANDVTIRNVRLSGGPKQQVGIRTYAGFARTRIENVDIAMSSVTCRGAGVMGGGATVMRYTKITGCGDGAKLQRGSLYEYNRIEVSKPEGSNFHLDGYQASGVDNVIVRYNYISVPLSVNGNTAVFVQSFNGKKDVPVTKIQVYGNYLNGGNYTVSVEDGKKGDGFVTGVVFRDNAFGDNHRYGPGRLQGPQAWSGNVWAASGDAVEAKR